jgi:hypothetical protein
MGPRRHRLLADRRSWSNAKVGDMSLGKPGRKTVADNNEYDHLMKQVQTRLLFWRILIHIWGRGEF